jgi:hypothetical protein
MPIIPDAMNLNFSSSNCRNGNLVIKIVASLNFLRYLGVKEAILHTNLTLLGLQTVLLLVRALILTI